MRRTHETVVDHTTGRRLEIIGPPPGPGAVSAAVHEGRPPCLGGWDSVCPRHGLAIDRCVAGPPRVVPGPVIVGGARLAAAQRLERGLRRRRSPLGWLVDVAVPRRALRWGRVA